MKHFNRNKSLNVNMQMMKFIKLTPKILWYFLCIQSATINSPQTFSIQFFFASYFYALIYNFLLTRLFPFSWRLSTFFSFFLSSVVCTESSAHVKKIKDQSFFLLFVSIKELYCKYQNSEFDSVTNRLATCRAVNFQYGWTIFFWKG